MDADSNSLPLSRFPCEIINLITERLIVFDAIETLRIMSKIGNPLVQYSLDQNILTVVADLKHDSNLDNTSQFNRSERLLDGGQHSISNNKIYPVDLKRLRESCTVDHSVTQSLDCSPCKFTKTFLEITPEDMRYARKFRMIIVQVYNNDGTCLNCDKDAARDVLVWLLRRPFGWWPYEPKDLRHMNYDDPLLKLKNDPPIIHFQIFKELPSHLENCRVLGQNVHCPPEDRHREGFQPGYPETSDILRSDATKVIEVYSEKLNYDEFEEEDHLSIKLISGVFSNTHQLSIPADPDGKMFEVNYFTSQTYLNQVSTVDVFFYVREETLRENYEGGENDDHAMTIDDLNKDLRQMLKPNVYKFLDLLMRNRHYPPGMVWKVPFFRSIICEMEKKRCSLQPGEVMELSRLQSFLDLKSDPLNPPEILNTTPEINDLYDVERGQYIMRSIVKFAARKLYGFPGSMSQRRLRASCQSSTGNIRSTSSIYLGRFQIHQWAKRVVQDCRDDQRRRPFWELRYLPNCYFCHPLVRSRRSSNAPRYSYEYYTYRLSTWLPIGGRWLP